MDHRGQFTFYRSFWDAVNGLPKKDRLPILEAIISYALDGIEPDGLSQSQSAFFLLCRPTLDSSRKKAANGKQGGSKPKANGKQTETEKEKEKEKEREKEKENECYIGAQPEENGRHDASELPVPEEIAVTFSAFWKAYPKPIGKDMAWMAWQTINPNKETSGKIMSSLEAWKKSGQWTDDGDRFIPKPAKWLSEGYWKMNPAPAKSNSKGTHKGASGGLGQAELEAIQRVLKEGENAE